MNLKRTLIILCCVGFFISCSDASAQQAVDAEKAKLIKELLEVTNAKRNAVAAFNALVEQNEKSMPDIVWQAISGAPEFATLTPKERIQLRKAVDVSAVRVSRQMREKLMQRIDFGQMIDEIYYPLFDRYFANDELRAMNDFYASPAGKKSIEAFPAIYTEALSKSSAMVTPHVTAVMQEVMAVETPQLQKEIESLRAQKPAKAGPATKTAPKKKTSRP